LTFEEFDAPGFLEFGSAHPPLFMITPLTPNVARFLASTLLHHVGGKAISSAEDTSYEILNPSDGSPLARVASGGAAEISLAVAAAQKAFPSWSALKPNERAVLLHRLADSMERHREDLVQLESLNVGKAITAAESYDIPFGIEGLRYFADYSMHVQQSVPLAIKAIEARSYHVPYGPCGFVFPWNFPFILLMWGICPALAAGSSHAQVFPVAAISGAPIQDPAQDEAAAYKAWYDANAAKDFSRELVPQGRGWKVPMAGVW